MVAVATIAAASTNVSFSRYENVGDNTGSGQTRFYLQKVVFNQLLDWLEVLDSRYSVSLEQLAIDSIGEDGAVNATVHLRR